MKKILITLLSLCMVFSSALPAFARDPDTYAYVYDEADILTFTEEGALHDKISRINAEHGITVIIVTADYLWNGISIDTYADTAYRKYSGQANGAVFTVCKNSREWCIQGYGTVETVYTEDVLTRIEENCIDQLSDGNYYDAFSCFAELTDEAITLVNAGTPYKSPIPWGEILLISLTAGFIAAAIAVFVMARQLKSVRRQSAARDYMKKDSLNITEHRDLFLYHTVTRTAKPKNNSSGGSRGSGSGGRSGRF